MRYVNARNNQTTVSQEKVSNISEKLWTPARPDFNSLIKKL